MKVFLLTFFLFLHLFALEDRQTLMDSISHHALRIGDGPNKTYTFVDPLCPRSQAFIELISTRKDLQKSTSYYIFLYRLSMFNSQDIITYIYQSKDPLNTLKDVMIYQDYTTKYHKMTEETREKLEDITKVAKQMNIKRRPYLLLFEVGSKYCRVSDGTAPCLEENDFD